MVTMNQHQEFCEDRETRFFSKYPEARRVDRRAIFEVPVGGGPILVQAVAIFQSGPFVAILGTRYRQEILLWVGEETVNVSLPIDDSPHSTSISVVARLGRTTRLMSSQGTYETRAVTLDSFPVGFDKLDVEDALDRLFSCFDYTFSEGFEDDPRVRDVIDKDLTAEARSLGSKVKVLDYMEIASRLFPREQDHGAKRVVQGVIAWTDKHKTWWHCCPNSYQDEGDVEDAVEETARRGLHSVVMYWPF